MKLVLEFFQHLKVISKVVRNSACMSVIIVFVLLFYIHAYKQMSTGVSDITRITLVPVEMICNTMLINRAQALILLSGTP